METLSDLSMYLQIMLAVFVLSDVYVRIFRFQLQDEREKNNKLTRELQHNQKLNEESLQEVRLYNIYVLLAKTLVLRVAQCQQIVEDRKTTVPSEVLYF